MNPATVETTHPALAKRTRRPTPSTDFKAPQQPPAREEAPLWQRVPSITMALTVALMGLAFVPPARGNPIVAWSLIGIGLAVGVWQAILWTVARRQGRVFAVEYRPFASHYVQAGVQFSIMLYWGLYWERVYPELPLILAQVLYVYILEALVTWSRGRTWRLGFGPLPIVVSTNLLLWFRHDWYYFQFLMLTVGALGKQFITWERDGKRSHIFNPSALGQFVFAVVLIATATTNELTWGREIATTFEAPHMLLVIFAAGLIVQYLFHVTLMTFAAVVALFVWDIIYTQFTGVYYFISVSIAAPIFLGMHLLITDPATSPRTNLGRIVFGALYGVGYAVLFRVLDLMEVPLFWDKLLPVPILNLCVPLIDRVARAGFLGRLNNRWETALPAGKLNLVHMVLWASFFGSLLGTGYLSQQHPGNSIAFWKKARLEGKPHAGHSLVICAGGQALTGNSGAAYNELGLICMEGEIVNQNRGNAARYFAKGCELGNINGCANVVMQYLFLHERRSDEDVAMALDRLEEECEREADWGICFLLGVAYETGRGRPQDLDKAILLYERCGVNNVYACKGLARIGLASGGPGYDLRVVLPTLAWAVDQGDAEACWYVAYMYDLGRGLRLDKLKARSFMEKACSLGSQEACKALREPALPPFQKPVMMVPGWSTAYPVE